MMAALAVALMPASAQYKMQVELNNGYVTDFYVSEIKQIIWSYDNPGQGGGEEDEPTVTNTAGHDYVDLGLPSGTLWATCNVGADKPEDYGGYYAWGETEEKDYYDWVTYKYCRGDYDELTKYCNYSSYGYNGFTDNRTVLEPEDDVAHVKWGGDWRMPTYAEWSELCSSSNCTWTWTTRNGVKGYKVTSKKEGFEGESIFLPAAGCRIYGSLGSVGSLGYYWSSSLYESDPGVAWSVGFYSGYYDRDYGGNRYYGRSVRPICP